MHTRSRVYGNAGKTSSLQISKLYGIQLSQGQILYDPTANCYLLKEDAERSVLGNLMPEVAGDIKEIAKYTSFESLIAILESGKIRMNSIVSMNDKTETDFLGDVIRNYEEDYEQEDDKYLFADKEFITSFTSKIEEPAWYSSAMLSRMMICIR